jgi:tRNA nucleotidyltransferase/poly(A) polymerase
MPQIFKVGGCIRDSILGIDSKDIDFTFVLDNLDRTVEEGFDIMTQWLEHKEFTIFLSTPEMFTIRAKFPKGDPNEGLVADFVLARKEVGYKEGTRQPILELGTLEDDLVRRDFTLNSLAIAQDGTLIDLFDGVSDLKKGILRTPLDPRITMMDDPLRILRCWRFSITKGFSIDPAIWDSVTQPGILEKLEKTVSSERIREELFKMFKHNTVSSLKLLTLAEEKIPGIISIIFKNGLHLEPSFRQ